MARKLRELTKDEIELVREYIENTISNSSQVEIEFHKTKKDNHGEIFVEYDIRYWYEKTDIKHAINNINGINGFDVNKEKEIEQKRKSKLAELERIQQEIDELEE